MCLHSSQMTLLQEMRCPRSFNFAQKWRESVSSREMHGDGSQVPIYPSRKQQNKTRQKLEKQRCVDSLMPRMGSVRQEASSLFS